MLRYVGNVTIIVYIVTSGYGFVKSITRFLVSTDEIKQSGGQVFFRQPFFTLSILK